MPGLDDQIAVPDVDDVAHTAVVAGHNLIPPHSCLLGR
jgi:hypothetical protein